MKSKEVLKYKLSIDKYTDAWDNQSWNASGRIATAMQAVKRGVQWPYLKQGHVLAIVVGPFVFVVDERPALSGSVISNWNTKVTCRHHYGTTRLRTAIRNFLSPLEPVSFLFGALWIFKAQTDFSKNLPASSIWLLFCIWCYFSLSWLITKV